MAPGRATAIAVAAAALLAAACVTAPTGPSVLVLPGSAKSFEQFRADDFDCRQYAGFQVNGTTPDRAAEHSGVKSAAIGAAVGAVAGGLLGGHDGAATGAGAGLIIGAAAGSGAARSAQWNAQQRVDHAVQQCRYAKGHKVPVEGYAVPQRTSRRGIPPPPPPKP
jgi:hypothetical protein